MSEKKRNKGVGAPKDNTNGTALKPKDVRQHAYLDYCAHLAKGKGKKSWFYDKDGFRCCWETMEKYIKDTIEFDPLLKKNAESEGYSTWENVVMESARGDNKNANTATLQMLMRNKYGWDRQDNVEDRQDSVALIAVDAFVAQLRGIQLTVKPQSLEQVDLDNHNG
jgi:hypothetical protein